jgi:APA family basic amino acid/polyamine antiporter
MANLWSRSPSTSCSERGERGEKALKRTLGPLTSSRWASARSSAPACSCARPRPSPSNAGPSVTLAFVVAGVGCAFAGLCYAEFASMIPIAGSAYTYSYATMGELVAWIIGWDLVLEYAVGAATVAIAWSQYLNKLLGILGWARSRTSGATRRSEERGRRVARDHEHAGVFILLLLTLVLIRGTKESALRQRADRRSRRSRSWCS